MLGFFPTMERYLTIIDFLKAISLVNLKTYFKEKFLGGNNWPRLLMKRSI